MEGPREGSGNRNSDPVICCWTCTAGLIVGTEVNRRVHRNNIYILTQTKSSSDTLVRRVRKSKFKETKKGSIEE